MIRLTSSQNPLVKEVRMLKSRSGREEKERYFIEGVRFVAEAVKANAAFKYLMVSDSFSKENTFTELMNAAEKPTADIYLLPDSLFASISDTQTPQGILAVLGMERKRLDDTVAGSGLIVMLDGIKDPGNMGTIIRTADAAGCTGVVVSDGCVDVYNPKVLRSTMGSVFHIPIWHGGNISDSCAYLKQKGFRLCVSHLEGAISVYDADLRGAVVLVIGGEAEGVSAETSAAADLLFRIPMRGKAESLNASVAAGIIIFEAVRQRHG